MNNFKVNTQENCLTIVTYIYTLTNLHFCVMLLFNDINSWRGQGVEDDYSENV